MALRLLSRYCIILILLPATFIGFYPQRIVIVQSLCFYLFTLTYWINREKWKTNEFDCRPVFISLILWSFITYVRGFYNIEGPSDWINLGSSLFFTSLLFPTLLFFPSLRNLKQLLTGFLLFGIPICIVNALFPPSDSMMNFQHNMYFVLPLLFCFPYISFKYKLLIILSLLAIAFYDIDRRSCLINVLAVFVIYTFYSIIKSSYLRLSLNVAFFLTPIILISLAFTNKYNVFSEIGKGKDFYITEGTRSLTTDSRTGIYLDVYKALRKKNTFLFGLGGNGKTQTSLFYSKSSDYRKIYRYGRGGTESGMLNNIQYGGIIGLIIYSVLFIVASIKATYNSNNEFMRMLGTFIAFKYLYSFIEDRIGPQGSSFYLFIWIGMCYNKYLRLLDERLIKKYLNQIFK